ncbi:MAG: recombination protein RmuC [Glaciihabitans sp.]|nr:recombination protein RmuC [Glaciihabitans sp.]
MPTLYLLVVIANTLLAIATLVLVLLRRKSITGTTGGGAESLGALGAEIRQDLSSQRGELTSSVAEVQRSLESRLTGAMASQTTQLERDAETRRISQSDLRKLVDDGLENLRDKFRQHSESATVSESGLRSSLESRFDELRSFNDTKLEKIRDSVKKLEESNTEVLSKNVDRIQSLTDLNAQKQQELQDILRSEFETLRAGNEKKLEAVRSAIEQLQESNGDKQTQLQRSIREELEKLRAGNEAKLEKMRETVDEKLQGTLEKRLGESFALVSDRLEQVQRGLGEMQTLASDVGGLKRVLTNVKSRGSWGEVQLSRQLEDMLTQDQFARNVVVKDGTSESVEFAVRLPGREPGEAVYLPIDSKLPQEDYERLLNAQEGGDKALVDIASRSLERAIVTQAKLISSKYINPPKTTDFAIMYLPTEGLFAEVVRQPGLASKLQNEHRVLITGPTTLMSLLNSLQMGFRTLVIEKRSSEVWKVLSSAKLEFQKYGQVWDKLGKQLETAQRTVADAGIRTRAVERQLRNVETLEVEVPNDLVADLLEGDDIAELVGIEPVFEEHPATV